MIDTTQTVFYTITTEQQSKGAYLDAWDDLMSFQKWYDALSEAGVDYEAILRAAEQEKPRLLHRPIPHQDRQEHRLLQAEGQAAQADPLGSRHRLRRMH